MLKKNNKQGNYMSFSSISSSEYQTIASKTPQVLGSVLNSLSNLTSPLRVDRSWKETLENSDFKTREIYRNLVDQTLKLALEDDRQLKEITANYVESSIKYPGEQPTKWHVSFRMSDEQRDERYLITDVIGSQAWPVAVELRNAFLN